MGCRAKFFLLLDLYVNSSPEGSYGSIWRRNQDSRVRDLVPLIQSRLHCAPSEPNSLHVESLDAMEHDTGSHPSATKRKDGTPGTRLKADPSLR